MREAGDEIRIEGLEVYAYHGVFPEENKIGQAFLVNAVLYMDIRKAGLSDDLNDSVNYGEVAHLINDYIKQHTYRLIETVAERLAAVLLQTYPLIRSLNLEIRKPQAPIGLPFASVSVKVTRGWRQVYVAVGANLGEKEKVIQAALDQIRNHQCIRAVFCSELIQSEPYGGVAQPEFLNGVITLETLLRPGELLEFLQSLEAQAGRERIVRWGARTLDLDILLYEGVITDRPELVIPHPDMHNRDFVLQPLAQLSPYLRHPLLHKTVSQLLAELPERYVKNR